MPIAIASWPTPFMPRSFSSRVMAAVCRGAEGRRVRY
jgi:hypothetical protein